MVPQRVRFYIFLHVCISLGGILIHMKHHPVGESLFYLWAAVISVFSLLVITLLYCRPSTVAWGFLLNAGAVIAGTIGMSYFTLLNPVVPFTLPKLLLESSLPGIVVLWTKIPISYVILKKMKPLKVSTRTRGCERLLEKV